ncbi:hypothetical protein OROGR_019345 [Orobanche gracilis]
MNFFKSILSEDPDPPKSEKINEFDANFPLNPPRKVIDSSDAADRWSFGGLIKTLAIESVIETYRRDLEEFGSGLKKETEVLRETASRAVKDLPASIEASASAAQGALGGMLKSTAEIISKESLGFASDGEPQTPETNRSLNSAPYSWFAAQLSALQSDSSTFCEDPEDVEDFRKWKLVFELENNRDEIDNLIGRNGILDDVYEKFVPSAFDPKTFWSRYFYRVDKLKQQESVRANLVKRTISVDDDDDLSWDVGDDDEEGNGNNNEIDMYVKKGDAVRDKAATYGNLKPVEKQEGLNSGSQDDKQGGNAETRNVVESSRNRSVDVSPDEKEEVKSDAKSDEELKCEECINEKNDERVSVGEEVESLKKIYSPVLSSHGSKAEDEELEWDEIEDIGSGDEKKSSFGSPNRTDLRKRLNGGDLRSPDDEDLSWDIEDDDEPVKA